MGLFKGTGRKDTGRTDKYSDENPKKDYDDYRKDYPNDNKQPRKDKKADPTKHVGVKSKQVQKQELISHIQNFQETFNSAELNAWQNKLNQLTSALYN
jgi:hypothetical protein